MSVHKKLMSARIKLQETSLKKTGLNKFAGYKYFELADFIPETMKIFNDLELCGFISYGADVATLTIIDLEDSSTLLITSPMSAANLKGAHPIQNLGAVQTYLRRYLWVTAMEILEHDALDSTEQTSAVSAPTGRPVTSEQFNELKSLLKQTKSTEADFLKYIKVSNLSYIQAANYEAVKKILTNKLAKLKG